MDIFEYHEVFPNEIRSFFGHNVHANVVEPKRFDKTREAESIRDRATQGC